MAVYYDSSFCLDYGGGTDLGSRAHIDAVIAAMNLFFQVEGLCLQIDVCEYDGECSSTLDPAQDPFLQLVQDSGSVCGTDPVLDNFKAFFANPEPQGGCDVRHLFFSLDPFPDDSTIGCAYLPGLCDEFAYAVNHVGFSRQIGFQAILVAHELGHNLNAIHTVQDCDTCIMDVSKVSFLICTVSILDKCTDMNMLCIFVTSLRQISKGWKKSLVPMHLMLSATSSLVLVRAVIHALPLRMSLPQQLHQFQLHLLQFPLIGAAMKLEIQF